VGTCWFFEPIYTDGLAQISYLVGNSKALAAAVIDSCNTATVRRRRNGHSPMVCLTLSP
jgi:hypothetical protein